MSEVRVRSETKGPGAVPPSATPFRATPGPVAQAHEGMAPPRKRPRGLAAAMAPIDAPAPVAPLARLPQLGPLSYLCFPLLSNIFQFLNLADHMNCCVTSYRYRLAALCVEAYPAAIRLDPVAMMLKKQSLPAGTKRYAPQSLCIIGGLYPMGLDRWPAMDYHRLQCLDLQPQRLAKDAKANASLGHVLASLGAPQFAALHTLRVDCLPLALARQLPRPLLHLGHVAPDVFPCTEAKYAEQARQLASWLGGQTQLLGLVLHGAWHTVNVPELTAVLGKLGTLRSLGVADPALPRVVDVDVENDAEIEAHQAWTLREPEALSVPWTAKPCTLHVPRMTVVASPSLSEMRNLSCTLSAEPRTLTHFPALRILHVRVTSASWTRWSELGPWLPRVEELDITARYTEGGASLATFRGLKRFQLSVAMLDSTYPELPMLVEFVDVSDTRTVRDFLDACRYVEQLGFLCPDAGDGPWAADFVCSSEYAVLHGEVQKYTMAKAPRHIHVHGSLAVEVPRLGMDIADTEHMQAAALKFLHRRASEYVARRMRLDLGLSTQTRVRVCRTPGCCVCHYSVASPMYIWP